MHSDSSKHIPLHTHKHSSGTLRRSTHHWNLQWTLIQVMSWALAMFDFEQKAEILWPMLENVRNLCCRCFKNFSSTIIVSLHSTNDFDLFPGAATMIKFILWALLQVATSREVSGPFLKTAAVLLLLLLNLSNHKLFLLCATKRLCDWAFDADLIRS